MLWSVAYAQSGATGPSGIEQLVPWIAIFVVFYFFMIRPQSKQRKEHQKFLGELKRGDQVLTMSGILGRIEGLTDKYITLEISEGVKVKILRSQIAGSAKENA
ncbi:MAG: preprotein translocase subunit YajC [Bdellovibrionales bacterium]|nr:preprotein translocase subunit YajC [Bdellovibrionales bacterium]